MLRDKVIIIQLWFAWKFVPLWYQQQLHLIQREHRLVVICLKIRTFVVSATTWSLRNAMRTWLWFAWKFVPLWYQQQQRLNQFLAARVVICLKIRTFVVSATTKLRFSLSKKMLWFAWKFVPLWYQQQLYKNYVRCASGCDLLENSYLCGISNNAIWLVTSPLWVVICLKIRTFVVSATTWGSFIRSLRSLWFAWKFVPLWYQQQRRLNRCQAAQVVICLKIRTFVVSATTLRMLRLYLYCCDLLENSYLCGISNNLMNYAPN